MAMACRLIQLQRLLNNDCIAGPIKNGFHISHKHTENVNQPLWKRLSKFNALHLFHPNNSG